MEWQKRMLKNCDFCTKKATGIDCDSRFPVASIIFSDVLESH